MGLGLIALGLLLLEGFQIALNNISIFPSYVSLIIIIIGMLNIKKKTKSKSFNYALLLGIIYFFFDFVVPPIDVFSSLSIIMLIIDILMRLLFYIFLFKGINHIIHHQKLKKLSDIYIMIYTLLSFYLLVCYVMMHSINIETSIVFNIILIIKCILVYFIAYILCRQNIELSEEYEIDIVQPRHISVKYSLIVFTVCALSIVIIQKPLIHYLNDASVLEYQWYGEIEDKIIVEGMWIEEEHSLFGSRTSFHSPSIWINDDDYQKANYCSIFLKSQNQKYVVSQLSMIIKDNNNDLNPYYGQIEGYHEILLERDTPDYNHLYQERQHITCYVILYDEYQEEMTTYEVELYNREDRVKTYYYEDDEIIIDDFQVDHNFIVKRPEIVYKKKNNASYEVVLSQTSDLKGYRVYLNSDNVYSHLYFPYQEYYIHIVNDVNGSPQIIKTVRLKQQ